MFARWLATLSAAATLAAQTAPSPASISGTVANSVTGEPVLRAHVMVRCDSGNPPQIYGALTTAKGEFSITGLPAGHCTIQAERVGFVAPTRLESLTLSAGTHRENVKLTLIPTGAITGRVLDSAGQPAQGANVTAEIFGGNAEGVRADDRGQFRLGGLRPGKYLVKAAKEPLPLPPEIRADGAVEMRDATTYYPDSWSASLAQRLDVKAGVEVSDIEIKMLQMPVVKVSGTVSGVPSGAKYVAVRIDGARQGAIVMLNGTFTIWRLDPGKYTLIAQQMAGRIQLQSAPLDIEVGTSNVENLQLRMVPPFAIAGQLRFDDDQARQPIQPPSSPGGGHSSPPPPRHILLRSIHNNGGVFQTDISADDSFTLDDVQPGRFQVTVQGVSGYVKSVRAGNIETEGDILDARNGSPGPVTITLSSNYCEISGTVSDAKGPAADLSIGLVAANAHANAQFSRSNSGGVYQFRVAPGKHKLVVMGEDSPRNVGQISWDDVEGESVELSAGDKVTKDLVRK